jgi:hypothetical protein
MPAIASVEDLKAAQKDLLEAKGLNELKAVFKKWRRIGWKNVCGAPMGKGRDIQRLGGGDILRSLGVGGWRRQVYPPKPLRRRAPNALR